MYLWLSADSTEENQLVGINLLPFAPSAPTKPDVICGWVFDMVITLLLTCLVMVVMWIDFKGDTELVLD